MITEESDRSHMRALLWQPTTSPTHKGACKSWSLPLGVGCTKDALKTHKSFGLVRYSCDFKALNSGFLSEQEPCFQIYKE